MVRGLGDYVELSIGECARQWQEILARTPRPRQAPFTPVETLLSYGLFFVLNPHSYGGANIHRAPREVHQLAALFCRSASSVASKMLNLDASRLHGARVEPDLYLRLGLEPERYASLYRQILAVGRDLGLGADRLPDFLHLGAGGQLQLAGQDELGSSELQQALDERRERMGAICSGYGLSERETTRLVVQRVRQGQHRFARQVLENYEHRCGFCGYAPRTLPRRGLLRASHVKPWRDCTDRERLDPRNGIAACPVHDQAFDSLLLWVNGGLRIHRADALEASLAADEGAVHYFGNQALQSRLLVRQEVAPHRRYLWHHQERCLHT